MGTRLEWKQQPTRLTQVEGRLTRRTKWTTKINEPLDGVDERRIADRRLENRLAKTSRGARRSTQTVLRRERRYVGALLKTHSGRAETAEHSIFPNRSEKAVRREPRRITKRR